MKKKTAASDFSVNGCKLLYLPENPCKNGRGK